MYYEEVLEKSLYVRMEVRTIRMHRSRKAQISCKKDVDHIPVMTDIVGVTGFPQR